MRVTLIYRTAGGHENQTYERLYGASLYQWTTTYWGHFCIHYEQTQGGVCCDETYNIVIIGEKWFLLAIEAEQAGGNQEDLSFMWYLRNGTNDSVESFGVFNRCMKWYSYSLRSIIIDKKWFFGL